MTTPPESAVNRAVRKILNALKPLTSDEQRRALRAIDQIVGDDEGE